MGSLGGVPTPLAIRRAASPNFGIAGCGVKPSEVCTISAVQLDCGVLGKRFYVLPQCGHVALPWASPACLKCGVGTAGAVCVCGGGGGEYIEWQTCDFDTCSTAWPRLHVVAAESRCSHYTLNAVRMLDGCVQGAGLPQIAGSSPAGDRVFRI